MNVSMIKFKCLSLNFGCDNKKILSIMLMITPLFWEVGWWDKKLSVLPENVGCLYQLNSNFPLLFINVTFNFLPPISNVNCNLGCNESNIFKILLILRLEAANAICHRHIYDKMEFRLTTIREPSFPDLVELFLW